MKSFSAVLFLASAVLAQDACEPGSFFKLDCNMCSCSSDGSIAACTMMACPKIKDEPKIQPVDTLRKSIRCKPQSVFSPDNCNLCRCSDDGTQALCTLKICARSLAAAKQTCEPNKPYRDYCNECTCSSDGTLSICTKMFCDKNVWNKDGTMKILGQAAALDSSKKQQQVCTPKSRFQENCNSCLCSDDGLSKFCTMMDCDAIELARKQQKQICAPRSAFVEGCNTCVCSEDGLSKACTMKFCSVDNEVVDETVVQRCQPGMSYSPDGCNTCICNKYGTASACTFKLCDVNDAIAIKMDEPRVQAWAPKYNQGDSCTPNSDFYSECNRCVCSNDGRSAYCTLMWCGI